MEIAVLLSIDQDHRSVHLIHENKFFEMNLFNAPPSILIPGSSSNPSEMNDAHIKSIESIITLDVMDNEGYSGI